MKTNSNLSNRQEALKIKHNLSESQFRQMLELLASLTPAERATLKDPDFIAEDEADLIICDRRDNEPTFPLDEVLREMGVRRAADVAHSAWPEGGITEDSNEHLRRRPY